MGRRKPRGGKGSPAVDLLQRKSGPRTATEDSSGALCGNDAPTGCDPVNELAGIEYVGISGISKECQDAVLRFIQFGNRITRAVVLSSSNEHCFLLTIDGADLVAVKSGFASGYSGEGPRRFSYVLQVLDSHGAEIEEHDVPHELLDRLDNSALTKTDLETLETPSLAAHPDDMTMLWTGTSKVLRRVRCGEKSSRQ